MYVILVQLNALAYILQYTTHYFESLSSKCMYTTYYVNNYYCRLGSMCDLHMYVNPQIFALVPAHTTPVHIIF